MWFLFSTPCRFFFVCFCSHMGKCEFFFSLFIQLLNKFVNMFKKKKEKKVEFDCMQWSQCGYIGEMSVSAVSKCSLNTVAQVVKSNFGSMLRLHWSKKEGKISCWNFSLLGFVPHFPVLCSLIGSCWFRIYSVTNQTNVAKTLPPDQSCRWITCDPGSYIYIF